MSYSIELPEIQNEIENIVVLWKRNMPLNKDLNFEEIKKKCFWFYLDNPFGPCKLWLLRRKENNDVIGSIGISFRKFKVKSQNLLFGLAQNFTVERKYRTLGPALMLLREACSKTTVESMVVYGAPGGAATIPFKRVGFKEVGSLSRYVKVLNFERYIKRKIRFSILAKILAVFSNTGLRLISKESLFKLPKNYVVNHIDKFDKSFDDLWEKAKEFCPIIEERSSVYLNWRFCQCPYQKFYIFCLKNKEDDRLYAYLVYKYENDDIVQIVDFLSAPVDKHLYYLFAEFIKEMRKKNIGSISINFYGTSKIKNKLKEFRFHPRKETRYLYFNVGDNHGLFSLLQEEENCFFTSGDDND